MKRPAWFHRGAAFVIKHGEASMIPGFGKARILIGSAPHCDIRLAGPHVLPEHAAVVLQNGALTFLDAGSGQSDVNGKPLGPGGSAPFDFRSEFRVGHVPVPNLHPALALMVMTRGSAPFKPGELSFGREPSRCNVAISNPNVSGLHASFRLNPLTVVDHGSTSGTWLGPERLAPETPRPIAPGGFVAIGPVGIPVDLALALAAAFSSPAPAAPGADMAAAAKPAAAAGDAGGARKHKTVIGQIQLGTPRAKALHDHRAHG